MKKLLFSAIVLSLTITSCKTKDDVEDIINAFDCIDAIEAASDAQDAYEADPSNANCVSYRDALQTLINEDCLGGDTTSTQAAIDLLPCS